MIGFEKVYYTYCQDGITKTVVGIATFEVFDMEMITVIDKDNAKYFCSMIKTVSIELETSSNQTPIIATSCSCLSDTVFKLNEVTKGRTRFFLSKERAMQEFPYRTGFTGVYREWFPDGRIRVETVMLNGCRHGEHKVVNSITGVPTSTFYENGCLKN